MRVFCDASIFVAGCLEYHPHYQRAKAALDPVAEGTDTGHTAGHVLAETFSVLSRMPTTPKLSAADALAILERNIFPYFTISALAPEDYVEAIRALVAKGRGGGRVYDMLHIRVAGKLPLDRIYTFNDAEWKMLAPELADLICQPPMVAS